MKQDYDRTQDALGRVVLLASRAQFTEDDAVLLAAVGASAAATDRPTAQLHATDPGVALMLAAGAASVQKALPLDFDEMEHLARSVPEGDILTVLSFAESLLSQSHPQQAWTLICNVVGAETAVENALGLDVAAHLWPTTRWQPGVVLPPALERQLTADTTAREAVAGAVNGLGSPLLAGLLADPVDAGMTPAQARVLAVAGAAAEPGRAVEVALHLLGYFPVQSLAESLRMVAQIATKKGSAAEVAAQANIEGFVAEQCTWAAAAAAAGALSQPELKDLAARLAPRIEDELDPGRELVAGLPLIEALLRLDAVDEAVELAARWRLQIPALLWRCLYTGVGSGTALLSTHPALGTVVESVGPADQHEASGASRPWWLPPGADAAGRLDATRDILAVVARTPWRVVPGSLADLLRIAR